MIAIQLYSLREQLEDASQLSSVLGELREIGYRAVEVAGLGSRARGRLGLALRRVDMAACAAHIPLERLLADFDRVAGECRDWGCSYVVVPALPDEYRSRDGYRRFANEATALAERLQPFGLKLTYHNHSHELERFGDRTGLDILFGDTPAETLTAELDTYWLQYAGANPAAWIRRLAGRVPLVHLKDMAVRNGRPVQAEIGQGNLDWLEILSACRDAATQWLVVEQDDSNDAMSSAALSYSNLAKLMTELELEC